MPLLIDGYNLLHVSGILGRGPGAKSFQASRLALLNFLAESLGSEDAAKTTVVFDAYEAPRGLPSRMQHRGIDVQFAAKHETADELIEELIRADSTPRRLTVVSSDHRIQRAAKRRRARAVDSEVWYGEVLDRRCQHEQSAAVAEARPPVPLLAEDVEYWIRQFGGESALLESLQRVERESESAEAAEPLHADGSKKTARNGPAEPAKRGRQGSQGKAPRSNEPAKPARKASRKQRPHGDERAANKAASKKRRAAEIEDLVNPFPPGYGEDLLDDLP